MNNPFSTRIAYDKNPAPCRCSDNSKPTNTTTYPMPPKGAFQSFNHCNLPTRALGSLSFQCHPVALELDGVHSLHRQLFSALDVITDTHARSELFRAHMAAHFSLQHPEEAGAGTPSPRVRPSANYLRLLRGWAFSTESREGAVFKGWVESRFGLLARYHREPMLDTETEAYDRFVAERSAGLYGTHALEAQLDLVYTYVQYELALRYPDSSHIRLYRGINQTGPHELLQRVKPNQLTLLLNNLSSFSLERERADEFGDSILEVCVPLPKVFCMYGLLPGLLHGENEAMVIGGVYEANLLTPR